MSQFSNNNSLHPKLKFMPGDTSMSIGFGDKKDREKYYYFSTIEQVGRSMFRGMKFHEDAPQLRA